MTKEIENGVLEKDYQIGHENPLLAELRDALINGILKRWYPLVIDKECGGYFTNISHDWKILPFQEKMVVSQARHIWTLSKAAEFFDGADEYEGMAQWGFLFLRNKMWDEKHGGFYQIRSRNGGISDVNGWLNEKRAYGNAFGIYALAALYKQTGDQQILSFVQKVFNWLEEHAYDQKHKGYFQFITPDSRPFGCISNYITLAYDKNELGYKDQNSSIHILEAFTELYHVWKDSLVSDRLHSLLELIRDKMVDPKGYLHLFFYDDWTPVSFRDSSFEEREANYGLDHVSFGHDYETAFLMLEASYALGLKDDIRTLTVAKRMLDHAIRYGWDKKVGGFFDGGYYFKNNDQCSIIKETKNWWAQAEGLNALLIFANIFPDEKSYYEYFLQQWDYIKEYILDKENGDWFEGGLDKEPHFKTGPKSHMWKCTYHTCRALMNCISILEGDGNAEVNKLIAHWKKTATILFNE